MNPEVLTIVISILIPMFCGFGGILVVLFNVLKEIRTLDSRLSRLEGRLEERGQWESRSKRFGEDE